MTEEQKKALSGAERNKRMRQKYKDAGLKKLELWIKPETEEKIKDYAAKLNKQT